MPTATASNRFLDRNGEMHTIARLSDGSYVFGGSAYTGRATAERFLAKRFVDTFTAADILDSLG